MVTTPKQKKMHVKIGDEVQIISGKDKGKIGTIVKTFKTQGTVLIENINMKTKHVRPSQEGETGQILKKEAPIHSSNVMLYSSEHKVASRYRTVKDNNGKSQRKLIKLETQSI
jgi:large subunit ribosomal protein L24|uniref:Large ribosomal subunit protein uL24c n=1 Tax=Palmaria decipiens TaxID=187399 RepID=A0A6C0W2J5_PALDE|nr:50S ribosomal protein L24 [Palmaria decipiens]QIC19527.1 50S ribosomal protein L24 [Palmaria decipiens]